MTIAMPKGINRYQKYSIELDCPPGSIRPNNLIGGVVEGTGLLVDDFETGDPFFGHQTWVLKEEAGKDELFTEKKPVFKERITALYGEGVIRYGSW